LSRDCGFGYDEMMKMPTEILLGLWNVKRKTLEEEKEQEREAHESQNAGSKMSVPSMSSMMSQARSMMSGVKAPKF
jgi:hypothetical protein